MTKLIFTAMFLLTSILSTVYAQQILFQTLTWNEVKQLAQQENKPIFVDVYAEWCGPCKYMTNTVFKDAAVADFMNKHYINYKLDGEKGEGINFASTYNLMAYPTLFFFDAQGNIIHKYVGAADVKEFLELVENTLLPENQLYTLKAKFDAGQRDNAFVAKYIHVLKNTYETDLLSAVFDIYWQNLNATEKLDKDNMEIFISSVFTIQSPHFKDFKANKNAYEKALGKGRISQYANMVLAADIEMAIAKGILSKKNFKSFAKDYYFMFDDKKYVNAKVPYLYAKNDEAISKETYKNFNTYLSKYANANEIIRTVSMSYDGENKALLKQALKWANRAVELSPNGNSLALRAYILSDLGKKEAALKDAKQAKILFEAAGQSTVKISELIEEIQ